MRIDTDEMVIEIETSKAHVPISASWSFSPAWSNSSWDILAASNLDVSDGSASFLIPLFLVAVDRGEDSGC